MMSAPIRVVVADDHRLFRTGLIELLRSVPDFDVIADCASGTEAITLTRDTTPDVLVLDVEMPGPGATATIHRVLQASPHTKIVILTMHDDPDLVRTLFHAGAVGYLLKNAGRNELIGAITTAHRNEGSVLLSVSRATVMTLSRTHPTPSPSVLSARETEVLAQLAEGKSNHDIAKELYISDGTVKRHLANIYAKLGATSRIDAVRKATEQGILAPASTREGSVTAPTAAQLATDTRRIESDTAPDNSR